MSRFRAEHAPDALSGPLDPASDAAWVKAIADAQAKLQSTRRPAEPSAAKDRGPQRTLRGVSFSFFVSAALGLACYLTVCSSELALIVDVIA